MEMDTLDEHNSSDIYEVYRELEYFQFSSNIRVVNLYDVENIDEWKARKDTIYIGDGSKWENPFKNEIPSKSKSSFGKEMRAEMRAKTYGEPVDRYEKYIKNKPELLYMLWELDDKEL